MGSMNSKEENIICYIYYICLTIKVELRIVRIGEYFLIQRWRDWPMKPSNRDAGANSATYLFWEIRRRYIRNFFLSERFLLQKPITKIILRKKGVAHYCDTRKIRKTA